MNLLAQLIDAQPMLFAYGPMGVMLAWFMFRGERVIGEIRGLSHRIDGLTKAMLVDMIHKQSIGDKTRQYAQDTIAKIDARSAADEGRRK